MALIQCPECEGNVSDQAPVCPHCGFPLSGKAAASSTATGQAGDEQQTQGISHEALPGYPGKPHHWTDRVPVAFLMFWGGMLLGVIGGGGNMVESLEGAGVQASERTLIGWLAWGMVIGAVIWFVAKNASSYLHYRNWKIDRLHQEMLEEAKQAEQGESGSAG